MRVYTIPASVPFLPTLARAFLNGVLTQGEPPRERPDHLADATFYLPTRRACAALRQTLLAELGSGGMLLPRIVALGDIDEDDLDFANAAADSVHGAAQLDLGPAMPAAARRLVLASLVERWAEQERRVRGADHPLVVAGAASAIGLADDLARLMDDMITRQIPWSRLDGLVPDELGGYWQQTLAFLNDIVRTWWPRILHERGLIEQAVRRDRLIEAECARLKAHARGPVIAAGSTGSMPSTAQLLHAIAQLPDGAVVLPGLDTMLDDAAWRAIAADHPRSASDATPAEPADSASVSHPQFAMRSLLARMGIARGDVVVLGEDHAYPREVLLSEALRPAATTQHWAVRLDTPAVSTAIADAMAGIAVIEAATTQEEAMAVAVAMRESHHLGQQATLVTPDRMLARRVAAMLGRWQIAVEDSGGQRLIETGAGRCAALAAEAALGGLEPATLLALLKHPLFRLGRAAGGWTAAVATLELAVLRGPRPASGSAGLCEALATFRADLTRLRSHQPSTLHRSEARAALRDDQLADAQTLAAALRAALAPLEEAVDRIEADFATLARLHGDVLVRLGDDGLGTHSFTGRDGAMIVAALAQIADEPASGVLRLPPRDYVDALQNALTDRVMRSAAPDETRLHILGPLEARLGSCDRIILAGLTEGVWPPQTRTDAWLSRAMRQQIGLDAPERRIGLSAHDFAQFMGAPEVILSRAAKVAGTPSVTSRFLHRLRAVTPDAAWDAARERGRRYITLAARLDWPDGTVATPVAQPSPRPARALRPPRLSVTEIETLIRDPYSIYARHILKLQPLDPVDMPLGASLRGSAIHAALGVFAQTYPDALPAAAEDELIRIGHSAFAGIMAQPEARALWWPRFLRIAQWYAGWERARRNAIVRLHGEVAGRLDLDIAGESFQLSVRADRIEQRADGTFAILDFKTGRAPSGKEVAVGLAPQLTLEAAMLRQGGFVDIAAGGSVSELAYVRLSGGAPAGETEKLCLKKGRDDAEIAPDDAADEALVKLIDLLTLYADEAMPYRPLALSMWRNRYGVYDHLARIAEWSAEGGALGEGGEA